MSDPRTPWFDYSTVAAPDVEAMADAAIARCDELLAAVAAIDDAERNFANTVAALDEVRDTLSQADGSVGFLAYVGASKELRDAALAQEQRLDTYSTGIGFREDVYRAVSGYAATEEARALSGEDSRLLEFALRDFRRNGMELDAATRAKVQGLMERLVTLGTEFRHNIDEYSDHIVVDRKGLAGLPDSYVERLERLDDPGSEPRWKVGLDYPELHPFLDSAENGALRRELGMKSYHRGGPENIGLLEEAIALRDEAARLLGYPSWAHYKIEIKMAKDPEAVGAFLADLIGKVAPKAKADLAALLESKRAHLGDDVDRVDLFDWRYYTQRILKQHYDVDPFAVAEYFPIDGVLEGMFDLYQRLVGARFVRVDDAQAWHPDVALFVVEDATTGEVISHFYLDLHPRKGKYGHAAAFTLRGGRRLADGSYQTPASAMVANFTKPTDELPSLLRHSEVVTLFHEFGHILHQTLTQAAYLRFAGTAVERDFVEAPSQMLEHWCWEPKVLASFARHYETGETIPSDLVDRMVAAKNTSSGVSTNRQLYFGLLDMALHAPGAQKDTDAIAAEIHPVTGFDFPEGTHFQAGFGHLFGYDAGYYGYAWSKVFGDDMYTRFEEGGATTVEAVGRDYRALILERGGTVDGDALVRDFLGREPDTAAFLRDLGLDG